MLDQYDIEMLELEQSRAPIGAKEIVIQTEILKKLLDGYKHLARETNRKEA